MRHGKKGGEDLRFIKDIQEIIYVSIFLRACPHCTTLLPGMKKKPKQNNTGHKRH